VKDTETQAREWAPGKQSCQVLLNAKMAGFLQETHLQIATAYELADDYEGVLVQLEAFGWIRTETEWKGRTFVNYYRAIPTGPGNEFRVTASLSNGKLSVQYRPWWMPT
jgi:hypothetical protein